MSACVRPSNERTRQGATNPDIGRRIDRILFWSRIQLVLLIVVVGDMVYKPTF